MLRVRPWLSLFLGATLGLVLSGCLYDQSPHGGGGGDPTAAFVQRLRNAMDWQNPATRNFAINCINPRNQGPFSAGQICDIWDVITSRWIYVSDPYGGVGETPYDPTLASMTISAGLRGDCDDYAVLMAACMRAVGGASRVVIAAGDMGGHAYAEVYLGTVEQYYSVVKPIADYIRTRYGVQDVHGYTDDNGQIWLNLDWQVGSRGRRYPGGPWFQGNRVLVVRCP